jgi:hypothetical protein
VISDMGDMYFLKIYEKSKSLLSLILLFLVIGSMLAMPNVNAASAMLDDLTIDVSLSDLQLMQFESWWSSIDNGTIFIRYVVTNTGSTYENPNQPILLNITFSLNRLENNFTFVNQRSFIDPYVWYYGETLSGCIHLPLEFKPDYIYANINSKRNIPEVNYSNNIKRTNVVQGVHISGYVYRESGGITIAAQHVSIKRCNFSSLQPSLSIRFDTDETGRFDAILYPYRSVNESFQYDLLCTDKKTSQIIHVKTELISPKDENYSIIITFKEDSPPKPNRIYTISVWIKHVPLVLFTHINQYDEARFYKIKWDIDQYSDWLGPHSKDQLFILTHSWSKRGIKSVKMISKDTNGLLSEWSESKMIIIF